MGRSRATTRKTGSQRRDRSRGQCVGASEPRTTTKRSTTWLTWGLVGVTGAACVVAVLPSLNQPKPTATNPKPAQITETPTETLSPVVSDIKSEVADQFADSYPVELQNHFPLEPKTFNELMQLSSFDLHGVDVARMNLLCAKGLPSLKDLNVEHALKALDRWAKRVAYETDRHLYRVTDPRYAEHYGHSEAQFRAEMLAQVLHQDLGVKYNPEAVGNFSFEDPSVVFIHGMIPGPGQSIDEVPGGTCATMPVLYVAVGRRLGYPLSLSTTHAHVFARWDGLNHQNEAWRDRFNIETTSGFLRFDDAYYKTWPKKLDEAEVRHNRYLRSLEPNEELALFLAGRGHHAKDSQQMAYAARCFENAYRYDPRTPAYRNWFVDVASVCDYEASTPGLNKLREARMDILAATGMDASDLAAQAGRIGWVSSQPQSQFSTFSLTNPNQTNRSTRNPASGYTPTLGVSQTGYPQQTPTVPTAFPGVAR